MTSSDGEKPLAPANGKTTPEGDPSPRTTMSAVFRFASRWQCTILCILGGIFAPPTLILLLPLGLLFDFLRRRGARFWAHFNSDRATQEAAKADQVSLTFPHAMLRYRAYTLACRAYMTLFLSVLALIGAQSATVFPIMLIVGIAMDCIRNRVAPDLSFSIETHVADGASPNPERFRQGEQIVRKGLKLFGVLAAYLIVVMVFAGTDILQYYFGALSPLHDLASQFVSALRNQTAQLTEAHYPERAALTAHVYTVTSLFLIGMTFWHSLHAKHTIATRTADERDKGDRNLLKGRTLLLWSCCLMFLLFYWFMFGFMTVDFERGMHKWRPHLSIVPLLMLIVVTTFLSILLSGVYMLLFRTRIYYWRVANEAGFLERLSHSGGGQDREAQRSA